jgi:Ankyrin repeats (3 copies)
MLKAESLWFALIPGAHVAKSVLLLQSSRVPSLSPQQYLDSMVGSRGYSVKAYSTLDSAYYSRPTPLQMASYGTYTIQVVKCGHAQNLQSALACGLSTNPCNSYGESLLHQACRRGDANLLSIMIEAGCDLQVADASGRTLLHDACWAAEPAFAVVEILISKDANLFYMADARGALPLSYVRKEHWSKWLQFLVAQKDAIWPRITGGPTAPPLALLRPNSRPVEAPKVPLTLELARLVAGGRLLPEEARYMMLTPVLGDNDDEENDGTELDGASDDEDSDNDTSYSEERDFHVATSFTKSGMAKLCVEANQDSWNEMEMKRVLHSFSSSRPRPLAWSLDHWSQQ